MFADSARSAPPVTVLDALENHFGDRPSGKGLENLSAADLDEVRGILNEFWEVQVDQAGAVVCDLPLWNSQSKIPLVFRLAPQKI
ncbi:hypothetical protein C6401_08765 [Arthrobacter woluwensis]|uniref:hypothetical protein n=1 Tax=Arthrobacter woluwensis TaxID=156980 RepID=UPI000D125E7B|nr:hypothetical protein [Arthrobacter woluwensis]PSS44237.1 hypothetical protein C6401_08765 [Arthrobacter woluwensis]